VTTYDAGSDPYCYAGTSVLKNIPGIRDQAGLERFESVIVKQRSLEPLPRGNLSIRHYRSIHRHLFQDVYRWAGRFRTVRMHKGSSTFCYPEHIAEQMKQLFSGLKGAEYFAQSRLNDFAMRAAHFLATLNAIHPFREGNGRAQNAFLGLLASRAGYDLDLSQLNVTSFRAAMIESFRGSEEPLARQIRGLLVDWPLD
jgi:cell filamentation protein